MFSMLLRSTLHWAILPNRSDSVSRVVAVTVGNEPSELSESSESDVSSAAAAAAEADDFLPLEPAAADEAAGRFSPSILTLARSWADGKATEELVLQWVECCDDSERNIGMKYWYVCGIPITNQDFRLCLFY